jgi:hypothetical protein
MSDEGITWELLQQLGLHYNRTFKAEQYEGLKKKKASRCSSQLCDIL